MVYKERDFLRMSEALASQKKRVLKDFEYSGAADYEGSHYANGEE
jgi:hypothetical protein